MKTQSLRAKDEELEADSGEAAGLQGQRRCVRSALHSRHKVLSGGYWEREGGGQEGAQRRWGEITFFFFFFF